jgi:hypothetical protein
VTTQASSSSATGGVTGSFSAYTFSQGTGSRETLLTICAVKFVHRLTSVIQAFHTLTIATSSHAAIESTVMSSVTPWIPDILSSSSRGKPPCNTPVFGSSTLPRRLPSYRSDTIPQGTTARPLTWSSTVAKYFVSALLPANCELCVVTNFSRSRTGG